MKFVIKEFFSKCDQISRNCGFGHLLKKSYMENFIFCALREVNYWDWLDYLRSNVPFNILMCHPGSMLSHSERLSIKSKRIINKYRKTSIKCLTNREIMKKKPPITTTLNVEYAILSMCTLCTIRSRYETLRNFS